MGSGRDAFARWEPGSSFEGEAFGGHALGRPKIDRLIIRIVADENATDLSVVPAAVGRDNEARATFPGLMHIGTGSSEDQIVTSFLGSEIGSPANRWRPQPDRLVEPGGRSAVGRLLHDAGPARARTAGHRDLSNSE